MPPPTPLTPPSTVAVEAPLDTTPSPAAVAKNIGPPRPVAQVPPPARLDPDDVPGGKLPPRRTS